MSPTLCFTVEGDTSSFECAHQLGKLCENRHLLVNLIPYNQTDVKDELRCPSDDHMREFQSIVASYGAFCTIRRTMGADIASACGQLVVTKGNQEEKHADIEEGPFPKSETVAIKRKGGVTSRRGVVPETSRNARGAETKECGDLTRWIKPLTVATSVAASCFVLTTVLFLAPKRRR